MRISVVILALSTTVLATGCQSPLLRDSFTWKRDAASNNQVANNKAALPPPTNPTANPRPAFNNPAVAQQQLPAANPGLESELAKGNAALANQIPTEAKRHFESVLKLDPQNAIAHHKLGQINDNEKKFDIAEGHYLAALSAQPTNATILCNLGWSYALQDRHQEARDYLVRSLSIDPGNQAALMNLGSVAVDMGDNRQAMSYFRQVASNEDQAGLMLSQQLSTKHDKLKNLAKKPPAATANVAGMSFQEMQQQVQIGNERQRSLQAAADRAGRDYEQFERSRQNQILAAGGQSQPRGNPLATPEQDMSREMYRLDQEQAEVYRDQRRTGAQRSNAPIIVGRESPGDYGTGQPLSQNGGLPQYQPQPSYGSGPNDWQQTPNQGLPPIPGSPMPNPAGQYAQNQYGNPAFDPNGVAFGSNMNPNMSPNMLGQGSYPLPLPNQPAFNGQPLPSGPQYSGGPQNYGAMPAQPNMNLPSGNYQTSLPSQSYPPSPSSLPNMPNQSSSGAWAPGQTYAPANQQAAFQQAPNQSSIDPARQAMELGMKAGPGSLFQLPSGTGNVYESQRPAYQGSAVPAPQGQQFPMGQQFPQGQPNLPPQGFGSQPQFGSQPGSAPPVMQPDPNRYRSMPNWQTQGALPPNSGQRMQ